MKINSALHSISIITLTLTLGCASKRSDVAQTPDTEEARAADKVSTEGVRESQVKRDDVSLKREGKTSSLGPAGPEVLLGSAASQLDYPKSKPDIAERNALLVAIDTPYQIFQNQGSYVHVGAWQQDGTPAAGANVFIGLKQVGKTDKHGSLAFIYPPKDPKTGKRLTMTGGQLSVVDANDEGRRGSVKFSPGIRTASFATDRLYVYADRGVYRPGDTVRVRAIGWHLKQDYKALEEAEVEFMLKDATGGVVGGATKTTSTFGTASLKIPIPATAKEGLYTLEVSYKNARQKARLQVRKFQPPAVQIQHTLGRFITKAQPKLDTSVTLIPSSGGKLTPGKLSLRAEARGKQVFELSKSVKGSGPHKFDVSAKNLAKLKASLSEQAYASMKFVFLQKDGTRSELVREMRYVVNPIVAVIELDKDQYSTGDTVKIIGKLRDLDGVPLRNTNVKLKVGDTTINETTDEQGIALFTTTMGSSSTPVALYVKDVKAPVARQTLRWIRPRAMVSSIDQPVIKEAKQASVKVKFPADVEPVEKVVHMDVVDTSGAIVNAVLLPVEKTKDGWIAQGKFTSPTWGSMLLTFFALGKKQNKTLPKTSTHHQIGLMTEGQNLVVYPSRQLEITLDGVPDTIAPGERLEIKGEVRDIKGQLVESELGITVGDRRVLALKDPLEITPMDQFYDPTLRTMSTTGSKILSWPVVSRNWGARTWDVALPPFPFLTGGSIKNAQGFAEAMDNLMEAEDSAPGAVPPSPAKEANALSPKKKSIGGFGKVGTDGKGGGGSSIVAFSDDTVSGSLASKKKYKKSPKGKVESRRSRPSSQPAPKVKISIRTEFPDTAFWSPHLQTEGLFSAKAEVPDSMSEQEIIVVASDRNGSVGLERRTIRVTQPVWAQAQLPDVIRANETLQVPLMIQNTTTSDKEFSLAIEAPSIKLTTPQTMVKVAAGGIVTLPLSLTASVPGKHFYKISILGGGFQDVVAGNLKVSPSGVPLVKSNQGWTKKGAPYKYTFNVPANASGNEAVLHLMTPSITSAMAGIEELKKTIHQTPLALTTDLASAAMVLQYAQKNNIKSDAITDLKERLLSALANLHFAQRRDGSFSYWRRSGNPSPYITAWVLEGMIEAQELDFPVPQQGMKLAADWLAKQVNDKGLIPVKEIAFWQGNTTNVQQGLSAHVFDILARMPSSLRSPIQIKALGRMKPAFLAYIKDPSSDVLTTAYATSALGRTGALSDDTRDATLTRLLSKRDQSHWEPSWFHAWGGRIEATTAMIALMAQVNPTKYRAQMRDALRWILATRQTWGNWHNERGTTSAIRALMLAGTPLGEFAGDVEVKLDGKTIKKVTLNPQDPFLSAIELEHLSLGQNLAPGNHTVEVLFGGPEIAVITEATVWQSSSSGDNKAGLSLAYKFSGTNHSLAKPLTVDVLIGSVSKTEATEIHIARSSLVELDQTALAKAIESSPALTGWWANEDTIGVRLMPGSTNIKFPLTFQPRALGQGQLPTISLFESGSRITTLKPKTVQIQ